jgi:hypothetical protein
MNVKDIVSTARDIPGRYLIGTTARHFLGDISREEDLFYADKETDEFWVGHWVTGFGFCNVLFPKNTARQLTPAEIERYNKTYIQINSQPPHQLKVD